MVIIGIDLHKRTHTVSAMAPEGNTVPATMEIDASLSGYRRLLRWRLASPSVDGRWKTPAPVRHLAQWLLARGESVEDVPCTATARVPQLSRSGRRKNDAIDAAAAASVAAFTG